MRVDTHCHLLPGLDDGARTLEESLLIARALVDLGYQKTAVTPHIRPGIWNNSKDTITPALKEVARRLEEEQIPLDLLAGAEHFFDPELEGRLDLSPGWGKQKKTFLIELPYGQPPPLHLPEVLFRLRVRGLRLILAHPERYRDPLRWVGPLREQGVLVQISLTSLGGKFGRAIAKTARQLVEKDLLDLVATDAHRVEDVRRSEEGLRWLEKCRGAEDTRRFTEITPLAVLYD